MISMVEEKNRAAFAAERLIRLRDGLAEETGLLAAETERMGDRLNTARLQLLIPRLRQGLVRIAVIGATSSGKSTLLNALLEHITVPENPNVSSPIPVWIGYGDGDPVFTVYESDPEDESRIGSRQYPARTFLKQYCYNLGDVFNRDLDKFSRVRYGAVSLKSRCLERGAVFIDTLGISASDLDTAKTNAVLEEGVDMVLFVSSNSAGNNEYTNAEIEFLRTNVMGLNRGKRQVTHPLPPENILFVHNLYDTDVSPEYQAMDANLDKVLAGFDADTVRKIKKENVYFVQALMGRYFSCGAYAYLENAPEGCREEELEGLEDWEWREKESMSVLGREEMGRLSGMEGLRQGILAHADRLCRGASSAAVNRIRELRDLAASVLLASSGHLDQVVSDLAERQNQKEEFVRLTEAIEQRKKEIGLAMERFEEEFISGLDRSYAASLEKIRTQMEGMINTEMEEPPEGFITKWSEYRKWDDAEKQQYIQGFLPPLMGDILKTCTDEIVELLNFTSGHDNDPLTVLEKSRQYILKEGKNTGTLIQLLENQDPGKLEYLADASQTLCGALSSRLEERLKAAVTDSLATTGKHFEDSLAPYVSKLNWKGLFAIFPHSPKGFWHRVRDHVLKPLAGAVLEDLSNMTKPGEHGTASVLTKAVIKAYQDTSAGLQDILTTLLTVVHLQTDVIDQGIEERQALSEEEKARYQLMQKNCGEIRQKLNEWINELIE